MIRRQCLIAVRVLAVLALLTGALYPAAVTALAQTFLPRQANGSLIVRDGRVVGSALIGQPFDNPKYFWGRLSASGPAYNAGASSGSNLGPMNPALLDAIKSRVAALRAADPSNTAPVPADLATASGSGLDPHISPAAAFYQAERVASARGLAQSAVGDMIRSHIRGRWLGIWGEPVLNVLELNLALDALPR